MKSILNWINYLSLIIFGVGVVEVFLKAAQSKKDIQQARTLAQRKQLLKAVQIGKKVIAQWPSSPTFFEQKFRYMAMGDLLEKFKPQVKTWHSQVKMVQKTLASARKLEDSDQKNPMDITVLSQVVQLYQKCTNLIDDPKLIQSTERCQKEIKCRHQFQSFFATGQEQAKQKQFKQALAYFAQAQELFVTPELQTAIQNCSVQVKQEEQYEVTLKKVRSMAKAGQFKDALAVLDPAQAQFNRSDGQELVIQLSRVIHSKKLFNQGLLAEKSGDFKKADTHYQEALMLLPELTEARMRLSLLSVKIENWNQVIHYLEKVPGQQANYLRGFAYFKQNNLLQADREWQSLTDLKVKEQRLIIQNITQRRRLLAIREIEEYVNNSKLKLALSSSSNFIKKFGVDPIVKSNLEDHIQPRLESEIWQEKDWLKIAENTENQWIQNCDIKSLHNWVIACYYQAQIYPNKRGDWLIAGTTALANFNLDPSLNLKNISWLQGKSVNYSEVSTRLQSLLSTSIDTLKDDHSQEYLQLRDRFRRDTLALQLIQKFPNFSANIDVLFILPECCERHQRSLKTLQLPTVTNSSVLEVKILVALYSPFGIAVAAAFEGDLERAIKIKPSGISPKTEAERFAQGFLSYSEGYYYLQQNRWKQAVSVLKLVKHEFQANSEWFNEIDRLCKNQRNIISNIDEQLSFAEFWYELLNSPESRSYLIEHKTEKIRQNLVNKTINSPQALQQLKELQKIDAHHPIIIDLINRIEYTIEAEEIDKLWKNGKFEQAVSRAKNSNNNELKFQIGKICLEVFAEGFNQHNLSFEDLYNFSRWAYELLPQESEIKEIYQIGQEFNEIHKLMKQNRYEDAVRRAKSCQYDPVRRYLAEQFIIVLMKGAESRQLPHELIMQLARFAYQLCPHEPAFQPIFSQLGIYY